MSRKNYQWRNYSLWISLNKICDTQNTAWWILKHPFRIENLGILTMYRVRFPVIFTKNYVHVALFVHKGLRSVKRA